MSSRPKGALVRFAFSLLIALVLPFPGPHIDKYIPIARVLAPDVSAGADWGFYLILALALIGYATVVFGLLTFVSWRRSRPKFGTGKT